MVRLTYNDSPWQSDRSKPINLWVKILTLTGFGLISLQGTGPEFSCKSVLIDPNVLVIILLLM